MRFQGRREGPDPPKIQAQLSLRLQPTVFLALMPTLRLAELLRQHGRRRGKPRIESELAGLNIARALR